jgi:hypothetical protein
LASKPVATVSPGLASKLVATVCLDFGSKPVAMVSPDLASKLVSTVSLGLASKSVSMISSGSASKPVATVSFDLALKPVARVYQFEPQNGQLRFDDLGIKIITTISWFGTQNQADFGLLVASQN